MIKEYIIDLIERAVRASTSKKIKDQMNNGILEVGKHTYGINHVLIHQYKGSESTVKIGNYCSLARGITILTGGIHPVNWVSTFPFRVKWDLSGKYEDGMPFSKGNIVVGNDVWIGANVTILSGVKVGDGAVLAANALITKDVPPYAIVGGNPASIIKYRFDGKVINELLKIRWWDWSDEKVLENVDLLSSSDINAFIERNINIDND